MATDKTSLGDRMKGYENITRNHLISRMPVILRLDGCHFHTFARGFDKPYDKVLAKSMEDTMRYLCEHIQGCVLGYTQSDEITLVLVDYQTFNASSWFDNGIQKMTSVAASMATLEFNRKFASYALGYGNSAHEKAVKTGATFDCRAFNVPKEEVVNNILWREQDCVRNSIQALGQAHFSHKELHKKSTDDIITMVKEKTGILWNNLPIEQQRGMCCVRDGDGHWTIDRNIPIFKGEGREYIERLINVGE